MFDLLTPHLKVDINMFYILMGTWGYYRHSMYRTITSWTINVFTNQGARELILIPGVQSFYQGLIGRELNMTMHVTLWFPSIMMV